MRYVLPYFLTLLVPIFTLWGISFGGFASPGVAYLAFVIAPIIECFIPAVPKFHSADQCAVLKSKAWWFDLLLYSFLPIVYLVVFYFLFRLNQEEFSLLEKLGLTVNVGIFLGVCGINVAHEIGHRAGRLNSIAASLLLLPSMYMHFTMSHNHWHHRYVSTGKDPSTARAGESIFSFWFRSIVGVFSKAWIIQRQILRKRDKGFFSFDNTMMLQICVQIFWLVGLIYLFTFDAVVWLMVASVLSILLLESINYIEHYGLSRAKLENGNFERVVPRHSWNSDHWIGRTLLFELTLHPDHHMKASTPYYLLESKADAPQLVTGYPGSILLALIPPLWFKIMDPLIPKA